jgi:acetyl-CoA synthetase
MPMVPELPIAMLACTRIGVAHSVIFGGFSPDAISDRCNDAEARLIITADAGYRRGAPSALKPNVDTALESTTTVEHVVVVNRCNTDPAMEPGRDVWWHDVMAGASDDCAPEHLDSEQLLYLLYTSGTTAKPKGIMHTTGGYLTQVAFSHKYVFDLRPDRDVYWCAADIGWVTGHSYIVYGPLANACTSVIYEGTPDTPRPENRKGAMAEWPKDRLWDIIERCKVTQLYTAPTAIRTFMKWGEQEIESHDLSSLRVLGTVGEPINPEAWMWYHEFVGGSRCPIVDTWWQTETGGHMISPLPGVTTTKPGSATMPFPGIRAELVDTEGTVLPVGGGFLTISEPWPGMLRTIYRDDQRYQDTYWSRFPGRYFAGDGAKLDEDGYWWILGRVDDVLNVAGHRIGTMEVESALVEHSSVAEAAVVGRAHDLKGQALAAFVTLKDGQEPSPELKDDLKAHVTQKIGAIARPDDIFFSADLPKTRSGKIMRRLLKDIAEGRALGDTTTLADPNVVSRLKEMYEDKE